MTFTITHEPRNQVCNAAQPFGRRTARAWQGSDLSKRSIETTAELDVPCHKAVSQGLPAPPSTVMSGCERTFPTQSLVRPEGNRAVREGFHYPRSVKLPSVFGVQPAARNAVRTEVERGRHIPKGSDIAATSSTSHSSGKTAARRR